MSRWFRHYAGMMRDEKLVRAALRAKQPIERVVWVFGVILESAAELDDGGRYELDHAEVAYFLRTDESDIANIEVALCDLGRVHESHVAKWGTRQFQSDRSAERTQRYRDRHKTGSDSQADGSVASRDDVVTLQERHCDAPETETETETETEQNTIREAREAAECAAKSPDWPADYRRQFWEKFPNKVGKPKALNMLERLRKRGDVRWIDLTAGLETYIRTKPIDRQWLNPATFLNQERWADQPAATVVRRVPDV